MNSSEHQHHAGAALTAAQREQVEESCQRFQCAALQGEQPQIDDYLDDASMSARRLLLEKLVELDVEYRRRSGEPASRDDYSARYPELLLEQENQDSIAMTDIITSPADSPPAKNRIDADNEPIPKTIDRYQIRRRLGRGSFGTVYLGWDPDLKREVAIKVPRFGSKQSDEQIEQFLEEARRGVQLGQHDGIVPIYDIGRIESKCYIVSQYIDGGTLLEHIQRQRPTALEAAGTVMRLADIVQFAHGRGWVHRDIKPSNILLDREGKLYLTDFGLTAQLDAMRSADSLPQGTPHFMAPEMVVKATTQISSARSEATPRPDHRTDIYNLGVVLYQLLTGRLPFEAKSLEKLFDMVLHSDPKPPRLIDSTIPKQLEEVCLKALAKDPAQRYRTAVDLREALEEAQRSLTVSIKPLPAMKPANRFTSKQMALLGGGAGLLVAVLLVSIYVLFSSSRDRQMERELQQIKLELKKMVEQQRKNSPSAPLSQASLEPQFNLKQPRFMKDPGPAKPVSLAEEITKARLAGDNNREFSLLLRSTNQLLDSKDVSSALKDANRMVDLAKNDPAKKPFALGQLGLVQTRLGQYDSAITNYKASLKLYLGFYEDLENLPNPEARRSLSGLARLAGLTWMRMGNTYKHAKRWKEAEKAYSEAEALLRPYDDRKSELALVQMNQGVFYSVRGNPRKAIAILKQSQLLAERLNKRSLQADVLYNLGNAQSRNNQTQEAAKSYRAAYAIFGEKGGYMFKTLVLNNWILVLLDNGHYKEARPQVAQLRKIAHPDDRETQRALKLFERILSIYR